eukprot:SAG11_NODE_1508_length_4775_cov_1.760693_3_plen_144_part_00
MFGAAEQLLVLDRAHQPFGPQYVGGEAGYASSGAYFGGPHTTWKAFLQPTAAGAGNFTITAECSGCYEDPESPFAKVNISNVVFGDVWHCSGQSNMWWVGSTHESDGCLLAASPPGVCKARDKGLLRTCLPTRMPACRCVVRL